jgi:DNA-binding response OmpR family regulator
MALTSQPLADGAPGVRWLVYADRPIGAAVRVAGDGQVVEAEDSDEFRAALDALELSLVVLAVPPAREEDLAAAVAHRTRRPGVRLLLLNDPAAVGDRLRSLERGFDDALPNSIPPEELAGRARILAERRRPVTRRRDVALTRSARLDPVARRVRRNGVDVHLRPKELALVTVFATHPGRAFSRAELLDRVWGPNYLGEPRTVDVHVRWLRAKLEATPARPAHFVTVRGLGYRFDAPPDDDAAFSGS